MASCHFLGWGFSLRKNPQEMETAGIHAGHPCRFFAFRSAPRKLQGMVTAGILPAHPVIFGLGVFAEQNPRDWLQPTSCRPGWGAMPARLFALRAALLPIGKVHAAGPGRKHLRFQDSGRIFCGCAAINRAIRGSDFASGPGALRRGRFAPLLSLALPKNDILSFLGLGFLRSKNPRNGYSRHPVGLKQPPPYLETAGIHAGLKQSITPLVCLCAPWW
jgi:hypothetical protein